MATLVNLTDYCSQAGGYIKFIFIKENDDETNIENVVEELRTKYPDQDVLDIIESDECFEIDEEEVTNKNFIFVFEKFETAAFQHIAQIKNVYILGLRCVLSVLRENCEVPANIYHIHNLSMKNCNLCFSSIANNDKKAHMRKLAGFMGGFYNNSLTEETTHLVTEDVFSKKYHHAGAHNIKILHPSWIDEMWKISQDMNFTKTADDNEFVSKFSLKIFHKLVVSSTGLENEEKKNIIKLIEQNGGEYSHTFKTATVKVLILKPKDIGNAKYKASQKHSIHCLDPQWIIDSVASGYAVNTENYVIGKEGQIKSSTPTKDTSSLKRFNFDNTMLSEISDVTTRSVVIDETQRTSLTRASINLAKKTSLPLGQPTTSRANESIRSSRANESVRSAKETTFKKPALKASKKVENFQVPSPPKFEYSEDGSDESFIQILVDKTVCIYGYTNDIDSMQVIKECEKLGAKLVDLSYKKEIDYVITSTEILEMELPKLKYKHLVSDIWLEESVEKGRCIEPLAFYHHSIFKPQDRHQVLKDEIFVCSNYEIQKERPFIRLLVKALGGVCKEALVKAENQILICPSPNGKKYEGALKWNFTVLRAEWLLACYQHKVRYDEHEFLVGESKVSCRNIKKRESIIPCSQEFLVESDDVMNGEKVDSPARRTRKSSVPTTPNAATDDENDERAGNISLLLEGMPTPQRITTKKVLLEHQKKKEVSPRTKLLKDLMQTPGNVQKPKEYAPSPAPELPACLLAPKDGNYGLQPDSSPASQWYYKRKLDALDDRYVPVSETRRKALKEVPVTPPYSHVRHDFFKKRLSDYDSPDPRKGGREDTQNLFMARVTVNMSNEASKFLNFEDTESDTLAPRDCATNAPQDSDILKLDEILKKNSSNEELNVRRSTPMEDADGKRKNVNIIDYNPNLPEPLVRWSNTQKSPERSAGYPEEDDVTEASDDDNFDVKDEDDAVPINLSSQESTSEMIFAISSGNNVDEKQHLFEEIEKLGGKVADQNFTHLILLKLTKSSKFFSALAAGSYVLHSDYVEACVRHKKFIDTDCYEYGNPKFKCSVTGVKENVLIEGPYRCRLLVENNPERYRNGLFTGMKFIIIAAEDKIAQFITVIVSGGGTIVDEKPEFKPSVLKRSNIDYCLVDNAKNLAKKDSETLKSCHIPIKNIKFIYDYLLSNNNSSSA